MKPYGGNLTVEVQVAAADVGAAILPIFHAAHSIRRVFRENVA
jgi:hypothetical protein